jgi:hypothetical protein
MDFGILALQFAPSHSDICPVIALIVGSTSIRYEGKLKIPAQDLFFFSYDVSEL